MGQTGRQAEHVGFSNSRHRGRITLNDHEGRVGVSQDTGSVPIDGRRFPEYEWGDERLGTGVDTKDDLARLKGREHTLPKRVRHANDLAIELLHVIEVSMPA